MNFEDGIKKEKKKETYLENKNGRILKRNEGNRKSMSEKEI